MFNLTAKRKSTGKYWGFGSVRVGKYGPQVHIKKTKELMEELEALEDGKTLYLSFFEPFDKDAKKPEQETELDDGIVF